jgi:hypothetical protein
MAEIGRKPKRTSAKRIERDQRAAAVLALRLQGYSLKAIGEAQTPPIHETTVFKIINTTLARTVAENVALWRRLAMLRLDELLVAVYEKAIAGDVFAVDRTLAILGRQARLMGADRAEPVNAPMLDYVPPQTIEAAKAMIFTLAGKLANGEIGVDMHNALLRGVQVFLQDRAAEQEKFLETLELRQQGIEPPWQGNGHELPS